MNDHCGVCGWPLDGPACGACGAPAGAGTPGRDRVEPVGGAPRVEDYPSLSDAFRAWHARDWTGMVSACLSTLGAKAPPVHNPVTGFGWAFTKDSAAIYVYFDSTGTVISVESPMLRVPARHRVPMLRSLLELNGSGLGGGRFCLRDDLVVLRFVDRLENLNPPKLVGAILDVALRADRFDDLLSAAYDAEMVGPTARAHGLPFQAIGTARRLQVIRADAAPVRVDVAEAPRVRGHSPEARSGFERMVRAGLGESDRLRTVPSSRVPRLLVLRAVLYLAWYEYREGLPEATHALLRAGGDARRTLVVDPDRAPDPDPAHGAMASVLGRLGSIEPGPTWAPDRFEDASVARSWLRIALDAFGAGPPELSWRYPVALGIAAELLVRGELPPDLRRYVRDGLAAARASGPTPTSVDTLSGLLRGLQ